MAKIISQRIQAVQPAIIPIVAESIRANPGTISLAQGVVFYGPPPQALENVQSCIEKESSHVYGAVHGLKSLRSKIAEKLADENQINADPTCEIVVTAGSNMGFFNAITAIADPGDEIILQRPYYFNHEMAITMIGCKPVFMETGADYHLQLADIEKLITTRTKVVVTISPNNPTGAIYHRSTLAGINELCRHYGLYHISDEAYEHFVYDGLTHFSPGSIAGAADYTISLYSLSKGYGFASWRIGYMVIPKALFESIRKIQDTVLICPPIVSQAAALGAIERGTQYRIEHLKEIESVRRAVLKELKKLGALIDPPVAEGAFYMLLRIHTDKSDMDLLKGLIDQYRIAVVPGSAFGITEGCYFRIAYGSMRENTALEGIGRLIQGLKALV